MKKKSNWSDLKISAFVLPNGQNQRECISIKIWVIQVENKEKMDIVAKNHNIFKKETSSSEVPNSPSGLTYTTIFSSSSSIRFYTKQKTMNLAVRGSPVEVISWFVHNSIVPDSMRSHHKSYDFFKIINRIISNHSYLRLFTSRAPKVNISFA